MPSEGCTDHRAPQPHRLRMSYHHPYSVHHRLPLFPPAHHPQGVMEWVMEGVMEWTSAMLIIKIQAKIVILQEIQPLQAGVLCLRLNICLPVQSPCGPLQETSRNQLFTKVNVIVTVTYRTWMMDEWGMAINFLSDLHSPFIHHVLLLTPQHIERPREDTERARCKAGARDRCLPVCRLVGDNLRIKKKCKL